MKAKSQVGTIRRFFRRYTITCVALLALGVFGVFIYINNSTSSSNRKRFDLNPTLEAAMNDPLFHYSTSVFLGWNTGDTLAIPLTLRWNSTPGTRLYSVSILNNNGVLEWSGASTETVMTIDKHLPTGIYYTTLELSGKISQLRRFAVGEEPK